MTIQEYFSWMFSAGTEAAYLCMGLTAFFVLASLGEFFAGARRGIGRQLLHGVFTVIALFGSYIITEMIITELHTFFSNYTVSDMLMGIESATPDGLGISEDIYNLIASIDTHLAELILTVPVATLVAPVAFLIIFAIVNLLLKIIFWIFGRIVPGRRGIASGALGMLVGLAEGVIVASLSLLPFAAISNVIGDAVLEMSENNIENEEITSFYDEYVEPVRETPIFTLTYKLGGEAMLENWAKVELGYGEIDMRVELSHVLDIISALASFEETDWTSLTDSERDSLNHIVDTVCSSEYLSDVFSGLFITLSNMSEDGESGDEGELFAALVDDMLEIFRTSTKDNVALDVKTFKNMYFILLDENILTAYNGEGGSDEVLDALVRTDSDGKTAITRIIDTLSDNPRTAPMVSTLTKLSVSIMAESLGLDESAAEIYDNVKDGVNDILSIDHEDYASPEEYKEAVADSLETTLTEQGITLEREIIDGMADFVEKNFKEHDELSDEEINRIILSYYDAFVSLGVN